MANLSLNDNDGSSGASDQDTLAPLPLPGATPWPLLHSFTYQYPHPYSTQPPPYHELSNYSYGPGSAGSQHSEGNKHTDPQARMCMEMCEQIMKIIKRFHESDFNEIHIHYHSKVWGQ